MVLYPLLIKPSSAYQQTQILTGSSDKTVRQWDIVSGKCVQSWQHSSPVVSVAVSRSGKNLFGSKKQDVEIYDAPYGYQFNLDSGRGVTSVHSSRCGNQALVGNEAGQVLMYELFKGSLSKKIKAHEQPVSKVLFSNDMKYIISASADRSIKVQDIKSDKLLQTLLHESPVSSIAVSHCNKQIISSTEDGGVAQVWDLTSGQLINTLMGHQAAISSISVNSKQVLTACNDGVVRLFSLQDSFLVKQFGNRDMVPVTSVVLSDEGRIAVTGDANNNVYLWDIERGDVVQSFVGHTGRISSIALSMQSVDK